MNVIDEARAMVAAFDHNEPPVAWVMSDATWDGVRQQHASLSGQLWTDQPFMKFMGITVVLERRPNVIEPGGHHMRLLTHAELKDIWDEVGGLAVNGPFEMAQVIRAGENRISLSPGSKQLRWNNETLADCASPEAAEFLMTCLRRSNIPPCFGRRSWR